MSITSLNANLHPSFYVGSSLLNKEIVKIIQEFFKLSGWQQTYDWAIVGKIDSSIWEVTAVKETDAVLACDIFIGILPGGRGMHTEFGLALSNPNRQVYLIGTEADFEDKFPVSYPALFYYHPRVERFIIPELCDSIELRKILEYILKNSIK